MQGGRTTLSVWPSLAPDFWTTLDGGLKEASQRGLISTSFG